MTWVAILQTGSNFTRCDFSDIEPSHERLWRVTCASAGGFAAKAGLQSRPDLLHRHQRNQILHPCRADVLRQHDLLWAESELRH